MKKIVGGGLKELKQDQNDFSHTAVFGSVRAQELPTGNFRIGPAQDLKDQASEDFCTFYATTSASEYQEAVQLDPYWNAFVGKVLIEKDPSSWGCDLRTACKTHVDYGGLEADISPFANYEERPTREEVLDPKTWDSKECSLDNYRMLAAEHRKGSFFTVDGPHDRFDNWRSALWLHRNEFNAIITGCRWRNSWSSIKDGLIPDEPIDPDEPFTPHAFDIIGQEVLENGEIRLVAQLSNGKDFGLEGEFFFPRSVVNSEFTFGEFMFNDMPKELAKDRLYYGISVNDGLLARFYKLTYRLIADIFV